LSRFCEKDKVLELLNEEIEGAGSLLCVVTLVAIKDKIEKGFADWQEEA
jgi:hypothetical protein